jgi:hypothetical protein
MANRFGTVCACMWYLMPFFYCVLYDVQYQFGYIFRPSFTNRYKDQKVVLVPSVLAGNDHTQRTRLDTHSVP